MIFWYVLLILLMPLCIKGIIDDWKETVGESWQQNNNNIIQNHNTNLNNCNVNIYFEQYKSSEFVKIIVDDMKKNMPNPPYDWYCYIYADSIYANKIYNFYEMGYESPSTNEQTYGLFKAIAYNLGNEFEADYQYDSEYGYSFNVRYTIKNLSKNIDKNI